MSTLPVVVVGAGAAGSIAAQTLAEAGVETILLDRAMSKPKPCGGAMPPLAFAEFEIPTSLIECRVKQAVIISPSNRTALIPVVSSHPSDDDYIAMLPRERVDNYVRQRAVERGARIVQGTFRGMRVEADSVSIGYNTRDGGIQTLRARAVIGADGARSQVATALGVSRPQECVALQERVKLPPDQMAEWQEVAELYLGSDVAPDFYAWAFPKHDHLAIGVGSASVRGAGLGQLLANLRTRMGDKLRNGITVLKESYPLPMHQLEHMSYDRAMLVGDAAGLVVSTSGEGIYWAMKSGRIAAQTLIANLEQPSAANLRAYDRSWRKSYGRMYRFLHRLQDQSFGSGPQCETFTELCRGVDVQRLTFDSYLHKRMAHVGPVPMVRMGKSMVASYFRQQSAFAWLFPNSPAAHRE